MPARASTTSMPSRPRSPAGCRTRHCSATICSRASSPAPVSPPISRWSRNSPPATTSPRMRHHRWARGDWQLLPWIFGRGPIAGTDQKRDAIPAIGRWKMLDNLRRTLSAPACMLALLAGWALPFAAACVWTGFVLSTILLPALIPVVAAIVPRRAGITPRSHLGALGSDLRLALAQSALTVTFLAHQAWLMGDAIARTLVRLFVTRRHLLEWVPAAQATIGPRLDLLGFYRVMAGGVVLGVLAVLVALLSGHGTWPLAVPLAALWIASPAIARWISRPPPVAGRMSVSAADASGPAADRAADLAVLRDLRDGGRPHAAAGQFPGGPGPGAGPPDLADQSRPVSPLGGGRPRFRLDWEPPKRSSGWSDAGHHGPPRPVPRAFLQLVRHARSAPARSAVCLHGRQRQPGRPPDRARQRLPGVDRPGAHGRAAPGRHRRRARSRARSDGPVARRAAHARP